MGNIENGKFSIKDVDKFNDWIKNGFDNNHYLNNNDNLLLEWIKTYLDYGGYDLSEQNVKDYYNIVKKDWISKY